MNIIELLQNKLFVFSAGVASAIVLKKVYNIMVVTIPDKVSEQLGIYIDKAFEAGDDIDDKWLLATVEWAESKLAIEFPNGGGGADKYALVASMLLEKLSPMLPIYIRPFLKIDNEKIKEMIENTVLKMKSKLAEKADAQKRKEAEEKSIKP